MAKNQLYFANNLPILRKMPSESVDLVYLDPPFNSDQNYNVLFAEKDGTASAAQIQAFEDTWEWDEEAAAQFHETVLQGGPVADVLEAFRKFLGTNNLLAYLTMMAPRLVELHRVLKDTGSLYLHCDPTASHYLKLLLDAVFGPRNFRNEIIWKRTTAHSDTTSGFSHVTDTILFYAKSDDTRWNPQYRAHKESYLASHYRHQDDDGRRYRLDNIIRSASMGPRPNLAYEYKGFLPPYGWRVNRDKLEAIDGSGRLYWAKTGTPYLVRYLDEQKGEIVDNLWDDVTPLNSQAIERLGYPTQKPEGLLERIILASSNEGEIVLDPFCGCGTATAAAQKLNRRWIGIDVTYLAIALIRRRLRDAYGPTIDETYEVIGRPTTIEDAAVLAGLDEYQFQWWALDLVHARGTQKKGADKGVDGRIIFRYGPTDTTSKQVVISVKAGHLKAEHVRDLVGVVAREKAEIGVLISMEEPTKKMREEAASHGFFESPFGKGKHPKIQLRTVAELLAGKGIDYPGEATSGINETFKAAPKAVLKVAEPLSLDLYVNEPSSALTADLSRDPSPVSKGKRARKPRKR